MPSSVQVSAGRIGILSHHRIGNTQKLHYPLVQVQILRTLEAEP